MPAPPSPSRSRERSRERPATSEAEVAADLPAAEGVGTMEPTAGSAAAAEQGRETTEPETSERDVAVHDPFGGPAASFKDR